MIVDNLDRKALFRQQCRSDIMTAAITLFSEEEFHQVTMDQIAQKAGFSKGNLYNYFENKDRLIESILIEKTSVMVSRVQACVDVDDTFDNRLKRAIGAMLDSLQTDPFSSRLLINRDVEHYDSEGRVAENGMALVSSLTQVMSAGVAAGRLKPLDSMIYVVMLMGSLKSLAGFYYGECAALSESERPSWDLVSQQATVFDLFLNGAMK